MKIQNGDFIYFNLNNSSKSSENYILVIVINNKIDNLFRIKNYVSLRVIDMLMSTNIHKPDCLVLNYEYNAVLSKTFDIKLYY
jgi:hypothetical protein